MNLVERRSENGLEVVALVGEVDLSWSAKVRLSVLEAVAAGPAVAIDLSAVEYIDSSGIASLVEGLQKAKIAGIPFTLVAVSPAVRAVLELARLDQVFTLADDLAAASKG